MSHLPNNFIDNEMSLVSIRLVAIQALLLQDLHVHLCTTETLLQTHSSKDREPRLAGLIHSHKTESSTCPSLQACRHLTTGQTSFAAQRNTSQCTTLYGRVDTRSTLHIPRTNFVTTAERTVWLLNTAVIRCIHPMSDGRQRTAHDCPARVQARIRPASMMTLRRSCH